GAPGARSGSRRARLFSAPAFEERAPGPGGSLPARRDRDPLLAPGRTAAPPRRVDPRLPVLHAVEGRGLALRPGVSRSVSLLRQRPGLQDRGRVQHDRARAARPLRPRPDRFRVAALPLDRASGGVRLRPAGPGLPAPDVLLALHPGRSLLARLHARDDRLLPTLPRDG